MAGLSPKLPVTRDLEDGFALTQTYSEMIQQNLKNLVLTAPGERMMDPAFGVGIREYLFEQVSGQVFDSIREKVRRQVRKYLPFVEIEEILFSSQDNRINIRIEYAIKISTSFYSAVYPYASEIM